MAEKEVNFTIPLRKECAKVPRYKRSKKAVKAVREFLKKNMKVEKVNIGEGLNKKLLESGRKNVVPRVQIHAVKEGDLVRVELIGVPIKKKEEEKKEKKKEEKKIEEKVEEKKTTEEEKKEVLEHAKLEHKGRETRGDEKTLDKQKEEKQEKIIAETGKK